jgi:predicted outer membrane lipoprotein
MQNKHDLENFGMALGIVKAIKLEAMDDSIRKSIEDMQSNIK